MIDATVNVCVATMNLSDLHAFMVQSKLGVVCSTNGSSPQSALVGIAVTPKLEIVFDMVKSSRKYRNLIAQPACSFVIGWTGEQTIQYEGKAQELASPELEHYQEIYFRAWPEGRSHLSWPDIVYVVVYPTWIRFSDFDQKPPFIKEFAF